MRLRIYFGVLAASLVGFVCSAEAKLTPTHLHCEYLVNPLGIDATQPRLSWIVESKARAQKQTAYQILVAGSEAALKKNRGDVWDSGKVLSDETVNILYAGKPLQSRQQCFWKVRVWDKAGKVSDYTEPASWEMGLLDPADWKAKWIARTTDEEEQLKMLNRAISEKLGLFAKNDFASAPMFRKEFRLDGKIKIARLYICGLGYHEVQINGKKVSDHLLDPAFTRYDKRILYVTHDVTEYLKRGENAIGVILGNGWFNVQTKAVWDFHNAPWREAPRLLLSLQIEFADGTIEVISSDESWRCFASPIVRNSIYSGEIYEGRSQKIGWDTPGCDDSKWDIAAVVNPPSGKLSAQMNAPIKAFKILKPVKITEPKPGVFVFDMGQNLAGYCELRASGPAGKKVRMRYGERLSDNGMLDTSEIEKHVKKLDPKQFFQTDIYVLKGKGIERWHSRFTYHGFQYVEVTGFPGKPTLDNLRGVFIHSAVEPVGEFECSNSLFNKIVRNARWSYLSNLQGYPIDCPHREKNGWTGDAHLACEQGLFNYDGVTVYEKWINDLADEQQPGGELPGIVPTSGWGYKWGNGPAWDSAFLLIPFYLYEYCGDVRALTNHYDGMKRYVNYLTTKAKDGIVSIGLPDWAPWKTKTPADITSTAYYFRDAQIVSLTASLMGKTDDVKKYSDLAAGIKTSFNKKFYNPQTGIYGNGSQTSLSCALYQGLVEQENKSRVVSNLVAAVEKNNWHIDTGILGAKYLLNTLTDNGRADVAFRIANQKDLPSWGWWIEQGATTLWEQWDGSESRNHIMFGDIVAWFYKAAAGINPDPDAPGFKHIIIKPSLTRELTFAKASYDSVRGKIVSDWKIAADKFVLKVTIPANTTATVHVPTTATEKIKEGNRAAAKTEGVKFVRVENESSVFEIGSGSYEFSFSLN